MPSTYTVNGDDVRVVHGGCGSGFGAKALEPLLIAHRLGRQDLEGHSPIESSVVSEEDLTHGAAADPFEHLVVSQLLADHG